MSGVAGRSGRKAFVPNSEQRHIVKTLTGLGLPQKHICRLVTNPQTGKPLDPKSLRKHFALEIGIGAAEANFLVGRLVLATIQGAPPPPGTVAITDPRARTRFTILFAKARMGWRETGVDEHRGKPGGRMIYRVRSPRPSATNSGAAKRCRRDLLQRSAQPIGCSANAVAARSPALSQTATAIPNRAMA